MNRQVRELIVTAEVRKLERRQAIERMARSFSDGPLSESTATPGGDNVMLEAPPTEPTVRP
jgi:hypothetical protein